MRFVRSAFALLPFLAASACACAMAGCGAKASDGLGNSPEDFSTFGGDDGTNAKDAGSSGKTTGSGNDTDGSVLNLGTGGGDDTSDAGGAMGMPMTCAGITAKATLPPLNLVVMLDRSGSMGGSELSSKWTPVTQALEAFLGDSSSTGMSASLQFFPAKSSSCTVSNYSTMAVDFTALPMATPFTSAISGISPAGETPTDQALQGALEYASMQRTADTTNAVYAVVLVTDGDPNGCSAPAGEAGAKQVGDLAATYATAADPLLTYVIGVGQDTTYLNDIAAGGGTTSATIVSTTTSAAKTSTDLITALNKVRAATIGCSYPIPAPPAGQTYAANAVNVNFTTDSGAMQTLPYDPACTGSGWHYDDPNAPTEIVLCGQSCTEVKGGTGGSVDVVFGCATAGGIPGIDAGVTIR